MKTIPLSKSYVALVDDSDYEQVSQYKWYAIEDRRKDGSLWNVYAGRKVRKPDGAQTTQLLHRFIMNVSDPKIQVDHRDSDGLNNQRENLRLATHVQNQGNARKRANASSKFKGVHWRKRFKKWIAQIQIDGKRKHLGYFFSEIEAALAYDAAAREYFGEFCLCNFPPKMPPQSVEKQDLTTAA